ncbi:PIG-X/PBN1 domain-containing protein [Neofusicoccum parvum]|uniref:PIG-X/PBN1 domain-containing protein n=1 Tax=Neofusicoccum parvum TaxID=310453 RepID=A0ACB5S859_9PEZI|nr:PIG-X/PBN1 domain-containing protein [Neofusicoccum parvum]
MRERITYLLHVGEQGFDPSTLTVSKDSLALPPIKAAKEHRLTIGFSELPQELLTVLNQSHELHIRWTSPEPYTPTPPYVSRISPGLHVYFTPRKGQKAEALCPTLKTVFGDELKCETPSDTFIGTPILAERFSMSASSQYHNLLPSLHNLVTYVSEKFCSTDACRDKASTLLFADYVDFDFDTISHALIINAFWAEGPTEGGIWNEEVSRGKADTMEVGVLNNEVPIEPEELSLSGFLTVVGDDTKAKPTLFSFPSRHHPLPSTAHPVHPTYHTTFDQPTGLHPTLRLSFPRPKKTLTPPDASCALHTYLTLPSTFFLDKYQFSDPLFLSSHNLRNLRALAGATDLEAPDWVVPQWGSVALFELAHPVPHPDSEEASKSSPSAADDDDGEDADFEVTIPLHLRYLPPAQNASGLVDASLPWPVVFWACKAEEGTKMSVNPFDRTNLGYDGLFGNRVMFYHVPPAADVADVDGGLVETLKVPVLDLDRAWYVEYGTIAAVGLAMAWLLFKIGGVVRESGFGRGAKVEGEKKKQ